MPWNDGLTGPHLDIAAHQGPNLRVIAGPGTGKTFALMPRVTRLLESGVKPEHILAVTFTRTAARDLVDTLAALGAPGADRVVACTLHSLSFSILSQGAAFQATGREPRSLLQHELDALVADLARGFQGKRKTAALIKAFEAYWARLQHQQPGWPVDPIERAFDAILRDWLRFHRTMLIGEVIPLALDFVSNNPQSPVVPRFEHILVDEYQDLNRADQALIEAIALPSTEVTVVGDEDQSIYSFRYAHPEGIGHYDPRHQNTHDVVLDECRRCPQLVVEMATSLIQQNARIRAGVVRPSPSKPPGDVAVVQHASVRDEVNTTSEYIAWYLSNNPSVKPGEVLVLATRRAWGYAIREDLNLIAQARTLPWRAQSFFMEESLEKVAVREAFTILTLLVAPDDEAALRAWLALGAQDGRAPAYGRLMAHCRANAMTPRQALDAIKGGRSTVHPAWFEGNYAGYIDDLKRRKGPDADQPQGQQEQSRARASPAAGVRRDAGEGAARRAAVQLWNLGSPALRAARYADSPAMTLHDWSRRDGRPRYHASPSDA
ncbi:MAG: UvrD-helicase domain-containing protein [Gemmatimonadaceae bacterium]